MSFPWFRLYRELKDDPKIGFLDDATFRVFIESMCWACEKGDKGKTGLSMTNANWAFRRDVSKPLLKLFHDNLLMQNEDGEIIVQRWEERQKRSDISTERVKNYRNRTKNNNETVSETALKQNETVQEERRGEEKRLEEIYIQRLNKLFRRRDSTPWSEIENKLLKAVFKRPEFNDELLEIEAYFGTNDMYLRRDISTLLRNWTGELDRWRSNSKNKHKPSNSHGISATDALNNLK